MTDSLVPLVTLSPTRVNAAQLVAVGLVGGECGNERSPQEWVVRGIGGVTTLTGLQGWLFGGRLSRLRWRAYKCRRRSLVGWRFLFHSRP